MEDAGKKLKGCIWERCEGGMFWGFWSQKFLSEEEDCDRISKREKWASWWEEEGKRSYKARIYLLCTVRDPDGKRFSLIVHKGRGFIGGWQVLAEKLHHLGVDAKEIPKAKEHEGVVSSGPPQLNVMKKGEFCQAPLRSTSRRKENLSFAEVINPNIPTIGEPVRIEVGEENFKEGLGQLECCLVG